VEWALRGVAVFPIGIGEDSSGKTRKRPLTVRGHHDATTDPATVARLLEWPPVDLWPREVLGIGGVPGSAGFVVLDLDRHGGPDGLAHGFQVLGLPGSAYRHVTGSGGLHVWLRKPVAQQHIGNASPWKRHGVDVRGDAGWVVLLARTPWGVWDVDPDSPAWSEGSELVPAALWEALTAPASLAKARSARSAEGKSASLQPVPASGDIDALIAQVRSAKEGVRNDTLNRCVFVVALRGWWTLQMRERFVDAALRSGLHPKEIDSTIDSAVMAGSSKAHFIEQWLQEVREHPDLAPSRINRNCMLAARVLAQQYRMNRHGRPVGMSARQLAEGIGLSHKTSAGILRRLVGCGLLAVVNPSQPWHGREYVLTLIEPSGAKGHTQPLQDALGRVLPFAPSQVQRSVEQRELLALRLKGHPAFLRVDRGEALPPSAVHVLVAVHEASLNRRELADVTGISRDAVNRSVRRLLRAGLLVEDADSGQIRLPSGDLFDLLDAWALDRGLEGRREVRPYRPARERASYRWGLSRGRRPRPTGRRSTHRKGGHDGDDWP